MSACLHPDRECCLGCPSERGCRTLGARCHDQDECTAIDGGECQFCPAVMNSKYEQGATA